MADAVFEIPQTLRDVSEQNLKLAYAAYDRLIDFVMRAMDAWMEEMPSYPTTAGFVEVQGRAAHFAKDNADSAFYRQCADITGDFNASDAFRS